MAPMSRPTDSPATLLLVDDNPINMELLLEILEPRGLRLLQAGDGETALEVARRELPALVLLDIQMPGIDGYEVCRRLKASDATQGIAVIFLSSLDDAKDKVRGFEVGAVDYLTKPFDEEEVLARVNTHLTVQRLQQQLLERNTELEHELQVAQELVQDAHHRHEGYLLGASHAIVSLREAALAASATHDPVLLQSKGGAGEEAVARSIHQQSARASGPFIYVDCQALEARGEELFGPSGKWGLASRGSIYLYGVSKLRQSEQEELAGRLALDDDAKRPRVIAYDRDGLSSEGTDTQSSAFRREASALWERIRIPSLAERSEDLPGLVEFFLNKKAARLGREVEGLTAPSLALIRNYSWPGNLEELRSVLECALLAASGPRVEIDEALLDAGRRIGNYQLVKKLGSGGMGEVWLAKHRLLVQPAAVKLVRPARLSDPLKRAATLRRFEREARVTAALESPNTVRLYDFGVTDEGDLYYVMERLRGMDLEALVKQFGPMPASRAVYLIKQACGSLAEAHRAGLVHRDIKPANLFACKLGLEHDVLKVLDFGLVGTAVEFQESGGGKIVGTPAYMSPEGSQKLPVDHRSDLYSLGCVLYWLLTGRPVFRSPSREAVLMAHAFDGPKLASSHVPSIPPELDAVVLSCLAKKPADRPASAEELLRRLRRLPLSAPWRPDAAAAWWKANVDTVRGSVEGSSTSSDEGETASRFLHGKSWLVSSPSCDQDTLASFAQIHRPSTPTPEAGDESR